MRILTVVGNRPQFIKAAAVSRLLRERCEEILIHTGQHHDHELSDQFFQELELPEPHHLLGVGAGTHAEQTARTMMRLEPLVTALKPDAVLVYGDTNATLGGAVVAAKAPVPLAHVEAGMRSFVSSMPEEVNRMVVDRLAGLLLCSTPNAMANLQREGLDERSRLVGDVMVDLALSIHTRANRSSDVLERLALESRSYLVATAHRAENVDEPTRLSKLVDVLLTVSKEAPVVFPAHPRTAAKLAETTLGSTLMASRDVLVISPLGYVDMARLLHEARALLTDSGGLQKEAYLAGVPCVTLRETTEWIETVEAGRNMLVGLDPLAAVQALRQLGPLRDGPKPDAAIYGAGRAAENVVEEIVRWIGR